MKKQGTIYFIEGLPGSGKTTLAHWLGDILKARLFIENAHEYPYDFHEIAGMTTGNFADLKDRFPFVEPFSFEYGTFQYVNIHGIASHFPEAVELLRLLYQWEFGNERNTDVSLSHYKSCSLGLMHRWLNTADLTSENIVMDSVWLQNPINELLFRQASEDEVLEYCAQLAKLFQTFVTRCIYLKRSSAAQSVEFATSAKGPAWTNQVAELITKTLYGLAHDLHGLDGMVQFFSARRQMEEKVLLQGFINYNEYLIENDNWERLHEQIIDRSILQ